MVEIEEERLGFGMASSKNFLYVHKKKKDEGKGISYEMLYKRGKLLCV